MRILCHLWLQNERGKATMSRKAWARLLAIQESELTDIIDELRALQIAEISVTCNDDVTVMSRRMERENRERNQTRSRVRRYRDKKQSLEKDNGFKNKPKEGSNANVTPPSSSSSSSAVTSPQSPQGLERVKKLPKTLERILYIRPGLSPDRPKKPLKVERDPAELNAWKKIKSRVTDEEIDLIEEFYAVQKSEKSDETWGRKMNPAQLMNQWTSQVELAEQWKDRNRHQKAQTQEELLRLYQ